MIEEEFTQEDIDRDPASAAAIIESEGGRILMIERADPDGQGQWGLPAGGLIGWESASDTMQRELLEETGLEARRWRKVELIWTENLHFGHIWEVQVAIKELEEYALMFNQSGGNVEVTQLRLFSLDEIRQLHEQGLLYKPHYNLVAVETYFYRKRNPPEIPLCFAPWDAPDIFWHEA